MRNQFFISLLVFLCSLSTAHADNWLSWSEFDENGENIQIYLTRETEIEIGPVRKITQRGLNVTPSLLLTEDELWLTWVDRANKLEYRLRYARIDLITQHILESGTLATGDRKVYSPALALSPDGIPVLAWSGLYGKFEDVRLAYFQNGRWSAEQSITKNKLPDTLPAFHTGEDGELILSWEHIAKDGISTLQYTLPSDPTSNQPGTLLTDNASPMVRENKNTHENSAFSTLPVSLHARQSRFLMGTQLKIPQ